MSASPDQQSPPGVVELREDVPLKPSGTATQTCANGPRFIIAAFAALSAAITIALLTQIYYGDYEVVPHGSVSSSAAECSRSGALVLRSGGGAIDATATAALCLAILAPHRTSLDASGALVYWEYRLSQTQLPTVVEWGGPTPVLNTTGPNIPRPPRLLVALAALHAKYGVLPWADVLQPAIDIAKTGITIPEAPLLPDGTHAAGNSVAVADYLETFKHNTSTALCTVWPCNAVVTRPGVAVRAGPWRVYAAGAGGTLAARALATLSGNDSVADATKSVVSSLQAVAVAGAGAWPGGVASGLAVVDPADRYVALVTGLSQPFGSGVSGAAWTPDEPAAPLDLAPAVIVQSDVCGTRYVLGAESASSLAQVAAAALAGAGPVRAVEGPRVEVLAGGALLPEPEAPAAPAAPAPAVNLVQQQGDALLSHADSRGGGLAERF